MKKAKGNNKHQLEAEDIEKIFETTWKNWESRRRCEQAHTPEYLKRKNSENSD